ncbi:MAG: RNA polymerase factor sigma-54 [Gammaproteobacteria bacterium]|nr:RNA polymerase factor sigma-54 [Gammaproteobacteria bacterium]
MKHSLQLRIGQQLTMTPQLQQAIRLLQLSTLELQTEIQEALESNPMLEMEEEQAEKNNNADENSETANQTADGENSETPIEESPIEDLNSDNIPEELPVDSVWDDIYEPSYSSGSASSEENPDFLEFQSNGIDNLRDHLFEQMHLSALSGNDKTIAAAIIDSIDESGYLTDSLENILEGILKEESDIELQELQTGLNWVQHLDPPGVGARNPKECLQLQLQQFASDTPGLADAQRLLEHHLELLAAHDFTRLRRVMKISEKELLTAVELIQSLSPRPGSQIASNNTAYIVPDVFVSKQKGKWRVELNPDIAPRLRINNLYSGLVRRADKSEQNNFLRNHLQEARWFIKSLQSRNETLLKVATAIVTRQRGFLEYGDEAMKPMVLRDIAEQLEMHESTISRVTTHKYMHTPRGIFEFKHFFSSHVSTASGGECSATAIRAMIRKLIADEPHNKPLSDNKIANILVEEGIQVARRTIAKYREAMTIPPSNERKRLA